MRVPRKVAVLLVTPWAEFVVTVGVVWVKVAVTVLLPFITMVLGLVLPTRSPLQEENDQPP